MGALAERSQRDDLAFVRHDAVSALGALVPEHPEAMPPIVSALRDPDVHVRRNAAVTLKVLGPQARSAMAALQQVVEDEDEDSSVRVQAEIAIGLMAGET